MREMVDKNVASRMGSILLYYVAALYLIGLASFLSRALLHDHVTIVPDPLMPSEVVLLFAVVAFFFYKMARGIAELRSILSRQRRDVLVSRISEEIGRIT